MAMRTTSVTPTRVQVTAPTGCGEPGQEHGQRGRLGREERGHPERDRRNSARRAASRRQLYASTASASQRHESYGTLGSGKPGTVDQTEHEEGTMNKDADYGPQKYPLWPPDT